MDLFLQQLNLLVLELPKTLKNSQYINILFSINFIWNNYIFMFIIFETQLRGSIQSYLLFC